MAIASVSHYFPSLQYLRRVIDSALGLMPPSGRLLVADMLIGAQPPSTPYRWYDPGELVATLEDLGARFALQTQSPAKRAINRRYDLLVFKD